MGDVVESLKSKTKLRQFSRYEVNPSSGKHMIKDLDIKPEEQNITKIVVNANDPDIVMHEFQDKGHRIRVYDLRIFVKLYEDAQRELVLLNSSGIAVFSYIVSSLKEMQEQIVIVPEMFGEWYMKLEGCENANTRMICYRGVIDLLRHEFIYMKVGEGSYFINVNKFFNGDRKKISWVNEISQRLKDGEFVKRKEVVYDFNAKPKGHK